MDNFDKKDLYIYLNENSLNIILSDELIKNIQWKDINNKICDIEIKYKIGEVKLNGKNIAIISSPNYPLKGEIRIEESVPSGPYKFYPYNFDIKENNEEYINTKPRRKIKIKKYKIKSIKRMSNIKIE